MIFSVLNDHVGKLVSAQFLLKSRKNLFPAVVIWLKSNDCSGKLVNAQFQLKPRKKLFPAVVRLGDNWNDHVGKLVNDHPLLK